MVSRQPPSIKVLLTRFSLFLTLLVSTQGLGQQPQVLIHAQKELEAGDVRHAITVLEDYRRSGASNPEVYNLLGIAYGRTGENNKSLAMFRQFARLSPGTPEAYNNLGAAYLRTGNNTDAEAAFRHALRLNPQDPNALYNLGSLLNAKQSYAEALPVLQRAYSRDHSTSVAYETAVALAGSKRTKAALGVLNSTPVPTGEAAVPWLRLSGTLMFEDGDVAGAARSLERALALAPQDEQTLYALGLVKLKMGETEPAIALLDQSLATLPAGLRHVREGTLLATYGHYREAIAAYEKATTEDSGSYDAFYNLAILRLDREQDPSSALAAAEEAQTIRNTGEIQDLLGDIYESKKQYSAALEHYQNAAQLDPDSDKIVFDLGAELLLHENYTAARMVFSAGKDRFPRSGRMLVGLGTAEFLGGKPEDSVEQYLKAADVDPSFEPAYLFLGEAFSAAGNHSHEVIKKLGQFAAQKPDIFDAQYYYGAVLVQEMIVAGNMGPVDQALTALRKAEKLRPQDARVYYQLGELYRIQKRLPESAHYYNQAINRDPNFPEALYKLGQTYMKMGKRDEAKTIFALHRDAETKAEANLYHRTSEIRSFVLKMRGAQ